jgi:putative tricarboxylic transport membrane protein
MDSFWGSFLEILSWPFVGFLVGGTLLGLILGVIPGLGGITILALLLPLTYTLGFPIFDRADDRNHGGYHYE